MDIYPFYPFDLIFFYVRTIITKGRRKIINNTNNFNNYNIDQDPKSY